MNEKLKEIKERIKGRTDEEMQWAGLAQTEIVDLDYLIQTIEQQQEEIEELGKALEYWGDKCQEKDKEIKRLKE